MMHLTSHITHSNGYAPCIAYYRSNGVDQLFRKLKPKPKLNPPNTHRSPIKICEKWHTHNVQFPFMPNAFRILKPIQKSSKRVWVFHNTGANAFAKNQMRLAYEDKRDLYCRWCHRLPLMNLLIFVICGPKNLRVKHSRPTTEQIAMLLYNDNIISAGVISKIGLLFHVVFYKIFNYFERCLWFRICIKTISQGEGHLHSVCIRGATIK